MENEELLASLKKIGLIKDGDICLRAMDSANMSGALFGAIGAAIAMAKAQRYLISINSAGIKIFDIEKTGDYKQSYNNIPAEQITKAQLSMGTLTIRSTLGNFTFSSGKIVDKVKQKEAYKAAVEFVKATYGKKKIKYKRF